MSADRIWIETEYLPKLWGKILYVGIADHTMSYGSLTPQTSVWHTIDVDPTLRDRKAAKHFVGDFLELEFKEKYEHVSLYGLWGSPHSCTNDTEEIKLALEKAHQLLNDGGTMMVGPRWRNNILTKKQCHDIFSFLSGKGYKTLFERAVGSNVIYWGKK